MKEIKDIAAKYAAGKTNEVIDKAIAQAYADGYRDGYKDCEEEISIDLLDGETEYVDLGLPSGTLWANDYIKEGEQIEFVPYSKAESLNIPTREQWEELFNICKWEFYTNNSCEYYRADCIGPNGNVICFRRSGKVNSNNISNEWESFFWIKEAIEGNEKNSVHIFNICSIYGEKKYPNVKIQVNQFFSGYKLPIRLVRTK